MSEITREWPSTHVLIFDCSAPLCTADMKSFQILHEHLSVMMMDEDRLSSRQLRWKKETKRKQQNCYEHDVEPEVLLRIKVKGHFCYTNTFLKFSRPCLSVQVHKHRCRTTPRSDNRKTCWQKCKLRKNTTKKIITFLWKQNKKKSQFTNF